jgi:hypothetical protein
VSPRDEHTDADWERFMASASAAQVEPRSEMRQAARGLREFYTAFIDEGFTRAQAMQLIMHAMTNGGRK